MVGKPKEDKGVRVKRAQLIEQRAYQMRLEGLDYDKIALLLRVSKREARAVLRKKLERDLEFRETDEEHRALELSRLDFMLNQLTARLQQDAYDNKAIELILKCQARRALILGTDLAKVSTEQMDSVSGLSDGELRKRARALFLGAHPGKTVEVNNTRQSRLLVSGNSDKLNEINGLTIRDSPERTVTNVKDE